jgi:lipoprotein-anchoring transpeptidase ErfK/SrfK
MHRWFVLVFLAATLAATAQQPAPSEGFLKHVEIDKTTQTLRAYEGDKLVIETRVSTGKWDKSTPNGQFSAGDKERMHHSKLFQNAPMPFSVQVTGDVFIHGFSTVPHSPASHGCIRVPLDQGSPARKFFDWVEPGTPIEITGHWEGRK